MEIDVFTVPWARHNMVSDEELNQHIRAVERTQDPTEHVSEQLDRMEATARAVHNELARRIEAVDETSVDAEELRDVREGMARLERRLDSIEARLD